MNKNMVRLAPAFKDYVWGGTVLKEKFGKISPLEKIAESWELSAHENGESTVCSGEFKGLVLSEYIRKNGRDTLGENALRFDFFPILIKLIDAADNLSVQVHPDDSYALQKCRCYGKTEMWYVLDCKKDACLYCGFKRKVTKDELKERIDDGSILEVLNKVNVRPGDTFFIEPGTVHAIGGGIVICEIQQNSNITYRVYDYLRRDKNGNLRELHIKEALDVINTEPCTPVVRENENVLAACKYFTVMKCVCASNAQIPIDVKSFRSLIVTNGSGELVLNGQCESIRRGDSIFVPAQDGTVNVTGNCEIIISFV